MSANIFRQSFLRNKSLFPSQIVRWKGHSKWQNIKHIKAENEKKYSLMAIRHTNRIISCIQKKKDPNPVTNKELSKLMKEALAQGVLKATIENAVKNASKVEPDVEVIYEVRGPGRVAILVEAIGKSKGTIAHQLNHILKKNRGIFETGLLTLFDKKGVIIISKGSLTLDQVEELAIEIGAEEVEEEEDCFSFVTDPVEFSNIVDMLKEQSHEVVHSKIEYLPKVMAELSKKDKAFSLLLVEALNNSDHVVSVHHNIEH